VIRGVIRRRCALPERAGFRVFKWLIINTECFRVGLRTPQVFASSRARTLSGRELVKKPGWLLVESLVPVTMEYRAYNFGVMNATLNSGGATPRGANALTQPSPTGRGSGSAGVSTIEGRTARGCCVALPYGGRKQLLGSRRDSGPAHLPSGTAGRRPVSTISRRTTRGAAGTGQRPVPPGGSSPADTGGKSAQPRKLSGHAPLWVQSAQYPHAPLVVLSAQYPNAPLAVLRRPTAAAVAAIPDGLVVGPFLEKQQCPIFFSWFLLNRWFR
jgi:hypothetical protein